MKERRSFFTGVNIGVVVVEVVVVVKVVVIAVGKMFGCARRMESGAWRLYQHTVILSPTAFRV